MRLQRSPFWRAPFELLTWLHFSISAFARSIKSEAPQPLCLCLRWGGSKKSGALGWSEMCRSAKFSLTSTLYFPLCRHIYIPMLRRGYGKRLCQYAVFIFSGLFHEYVASPPLRIIRGHFIIGFVFQVGYASFFGRGGAVHTNCGTWKRLLCPENPWT